VPFVLLAFLLAGDRKGLAGAGAGPDWTIVGPGGETKGVSPSTDPGKEVALLIGSEVVGSNIDD
jgi:hypothetical protein